MKEIVLMSIIVAVMATPAIANPTFGDSGADLQGVLNSITIAPVPGTSSVNVTTDFLSDIADSYWSITASGGSVSTMIIELAEFATTNKFGVYSGTNSVELFDGSDITGDQVLLSIKADGSVYKNFQDTYVDFGGNHFGFYLDSSDEQDDSMTGGRWYSDTSLNSDGIDHMAAYQGKDVDTIQVPGYFPGTWTDNEFVLAWEYLDFDVYSDGDYTDFVVIVESVLPVPVPGAFLLGGIGVSLVGWLKRRRSL